MIEKKTFIKRETISGTNCSTEKKDYQIREYELDLRWLDG